MPSKDELDGNLEWRTDAALRRKEGLTKRTLQIPVSEVPARAPIIVDPEATAFDAILKMQENHVGAVLVQTEEGVGILTERDIIMKIPSKKRLFKDCAVREIMTKNALTLHRDDTIAFALNYMAIGGYRHIPVVNDKNEPVGQLSIKDILRYIVEFFPEAVISLPPKPQKDSIPRYGG
ncbi:MAG: CBS domain-containing protein [Candidatus Eisenbacteria bacterium]|uniref:CBS domain-containing protein n=1 Tax=Eiseniibacteriota bacterium TaxID=2212470 RepID=A0A948RXK9_UNCEI|nr:CBS domain-containing protein [Candidatus Eisenbacteria bacterium]MBU1950191.1 CBS domain-containing protein [Candidatus Eisenbacteria bacterium]MBU2691412.1 CBS domain-containing protein [Candidatus Eisenbacteria bacterium]